MEREELARIDLRALAEAAGARFRGSSLSSRCPLPRHGGDRSGRNFGIYQGADGIWRWKCFSSCPADANGGTVIDFYMAWKEVDVATAIRELANSGLVFAKRPAQEPGVIRECAQATPAWSARAEDFVRYASDQLWTRVGEGARQYLWNECGLVNETIVEARLGFNPKDVWDEPGRWGRHDKKVYCPRGIVIPHMRDGRVQFVNVRRSRSCDLLGEYIKSMPGSKDNPKYMAVAGGYRGLYGLDWLRDLPFLIMTEGEFDMLLARQCVGQIADVATLGGAGQHVDSGAIYRLLSYMRILAVYDADESGQHGVQHLANLSSRVIIGTPPDHDLRDYWGHGGNLGRWLAELVVDQAEQLLPKINEQMRAFDCLLDTYKAALKAL